MKTDILSNWNFSRLLRLAIGVIILIEAIHSGDPLIGLGGVFFIGMAVLNAGCCGSGRCDTPLKKSRGVIEDVKYEEVK
jgi:hypothetical protein